MPTALLEKPKTHVALVLDKSGSMASIKDKALTGFNEQIQQLKINAKDGHDIRCSIVSFNSDVTENVWNVPAEEMTELTGADYKPDGGTALMDAFGYTLNKLMSLADEDPNVAFLVVVISDGETNSDRKFSSEDVKKLVSACNEEKRWTISYIGCDAAYVDKVVKSTGIYAGNAASANYSNRAFSASVVSNVNENSRKYFRTRGLIGATLSAANEDTLDMLASSYCSVDGKAADYGNVVPDTLAKETPSVKLRGLGSEHSDNTKP